MRKLSFDEIENWQKFEDLVAAYFYSQVQNPTNGIVNCTILPTGSGSDGGTDLLVNLVFGDLIVDFQRTWVVQCKFYNRNVRKSDLANVNIPTLIHQHKANGYLLVCKKGTVNTLRQQFSDLNKNCKFGYSYKIWTGSDFLQKIFSTKSLIQQFFPLYYSFTKKLDKS